MSILHLKLNISIMKTKPLHDWMMFFIMELLLKHLNFYDESPDRPPTHLIWRRNLNLSTDIDEWNANAVQYAYID